MPSRKYLAVPQLADVALSVPKFSTDTTVFLELVPHMLRYLIPYHHLCAVYKPSTTSFLLGRFAHILNPQKMHCTSTYKHQLHPGMCHAACVGIPLITLNGIEARSLSNALCLSVVTMIMAD